MSACVRLVLVLALVAVVASACAQASDSPFPIICEETTPVLDRVLARTQQILGSPKDVLSYVDTLIGSGGDGYGAAALPPGAQAPFGMARGSPDTSINAIRVPWRHPGGYSYCDTYVRAFSHLHFVGAGVLDYGNLGMMPLNEISDATVYCFNPLQPIDPKVDIRVCNYRAPFSHDTEVATAGYYATDLLPPKQGKIRAEITATEHVVVHRYTFEQSNQHVILMDLAHLMSINPGACRNSSVSVDPKAGVISGWIDNVGGYSGRFGGFIVYFYATFNRPVDASHSGTWTTGKLLPGQWTLTGNQVGAYFTFAPQSGDQSVEAFVGLSFISVEQAAKNLQEEVSASDTFDSVKQRTQDQWRQELTVVSVNGMTDATVSAEDMRVRLKEDPSLEDYLVQFYSNLYHAFMGPTLFSEAGGVYRGFDKQVHNLPSNMQGYYTDLSIWDIYRSEWILLVMLQPDRASDIVNSMLLMYDQQGILPKWAMADGDTDGMNGLHSATMISFAQAMGLGLDKINYTSALEASVHSVRATESQYLSHHYDPNNPCDTLAHVLDDMCVAGLAERLGNQQVFEDFSSTSQYWKNIFDTKNYFFCAKDTDGSFVECDKEDWPIASRNPFDSFYTEGDGWQYRFSLEQDIPALIQAYNGSENFVSLLTEFMSKSQTYKENFLPNEWYWAGNEPDIHAPILFNYAGQPRLSQYWSRVIMDTRYSSLPNGIPGNDDYGTLSSWYVLHALGLYPEPCSGKFAVTSPLFESIHVRRQGKDRPETLTVTTKNFDIKNSQTQQVQVNGQTLDPAAYFVQLNECWGGGGGSAECSLLFEY